MQSYCVFIEPITACNFKCEFCSTIAMTRKPAVLSLEQLQHCLQQIKGLNAKIEYVYFPIVGEPLLHKQIKEASEMVNSYGYPFFITTNGSLLREEHLSIKTRWCISVQNASADNFHIRHAKISYEEYIKNIANFVKNVDGRRDICIYLMGIINNSRPFPKDMLGFKDYYSSEFLAEVNERLSQMVPWFKGITKMPDNMKGFPLGKRVSFVGRRLEEWCGVLVPPNYKIVPPPVIKCNHYFFKHLCIHADGNVTPCVMDYDCELKLGNIFQTPLKEIMEERNNRGNLAQYKLCGGCVGKWVKI